MERVLRGEARSGVRRTLMLAPIAQAPFYAVELSLSC